MMASRALADGGAMNGLISADVPGVRVRPIQTYNTQCGLPVTKPDKLPSLMSMIEGFRSLSVHENSEGLHPKRGLCGVTFQPPNMGVWLLGLAKDATPRGRGCRGHSHLAPPSRAADCIERGSPALVALGEMEASR